MALDESSELFLMSCGEPSPYYGHGPGIHTSWIRALTLYGVWGCPRLRRCARLLFHNSPGACRSPDPASPSHYSRSVGRAALMNPSDGGEE